MNHVFKFSPSTVFGSSLKSKCYDNFYICSHCLRHHRTSPRIHREYCSYKTAVFRKLVSNHRSPKKKIAELVRITNAKTTQTTMPVGKLKPAHVAAFAEEPGMILKSLKNPKSVEKHLENTRFNTSSGKLFSTESKNVKNFESKNDLKVNISASSDDCHFTTPFLVEIPYDTSYFAKSNFKVPTNEFKFENNIKDKKHSFYPINSKEAMRYKELKKLTNTTINIESEKNIFNEENFSYRSVYRNNQYNEKNIQVNEDHDIQVHNRNSIPDHFRSDLNSWYNARSSKINDAHEQQKNLIYSYIDVCVTQGLLDFAYEQVTNQRAGKQIDDPEVYNAVIAGFSKNENFTIVKNIVMEMKKNGVPWNCRTCALYLYSLSMVPHSVCKSREKLVIEALQALKAGGYELNDIFTKLKLREEQKVKILKQVQTVLPYFEITPSSVNLSSNCSMIADIYRGESSFKSPFKDISYQEVERMINEQLSVEKELAIPVKTVMNMGNPALAPKYYEIWMKLTKDWEKNLTLTLDLHMRVLKAESKRKMKKPSLYVYLKSVPSETLVKIMLQEINMLTSLSETYSPSTFVQYEQLGHKLWFSYIVSKKTQDKSQTDEIKRHIAKYISWYGNPGGPARNARQKWQMLIEDDPVLGLWDEEIIGWPRGIKKGVGKFLYNIMFKSTLVPNKNNLGTSKKMFPGLYLILRYQQGKLSEQIKCHPYISRLYRNANINTLLFGSYQLPMICPPKPWYSTESGGYFILPTDFVRKPYADSMVPSFKNLPPEQLYPVFDSLNQLQSVPWMVNEKVLDVVLQVFKQGGSQDLNVPIKPMESLPVVNLKGLLFKERCQAYEEKVKLLKAKQNSYGLWCEGLYKISLANHFRKKVFWLPQNLDFRGRVYPVPPHVNHLCADLYRSLLLFAKKERLGPKGLDWLKIHVINLSGTHKRKSVEDRLSYANAILPDILDSAENPLNGKNWWMTSENPWQTLAACFEIYDAIESGSPQDFESSFPVHQDGSCNGLQHYAALGRDSFGARSVNLEPCDEPQDVYTVVANIIENVREKDAENGVSIAKILDGYVQRKVIKQTIMTTVYGVTRYGAREQIAGQLRNIKDFPEDKVWEAADYLTIKIFGGLQQMFTSAKNIQDWFMKCADVITGNYKDVVTWITPLGLPVTQPYSNRAPTDSDCYYVPNRRKQKNAFPPNFIHSLDSTHMMLTSLFCEQSGVTFASVHDCFWTHANTVEVMNRICREQFIALHSNEILKNLSNYFINYYQRGRNEVEKKLLPRDSDVFSCVPKTGDFDLNTVMDSVYFFS